MSPDQEARFFAKFQSIIEEHKTYSDETLKNTVSAIKADFAAAFPEGDMKGHCDYHKELIEREMARREFWQKMRYELYRYGLLVFLLWFLAQVAHAVGIDFWKLWDKFGGLLK